MKVSKAGKTWLDYHQIHSQKNTIRTHSFVKETVDEIIFRTIKPRDRLMLELLARGAMR